MNTTSVPNFILHTNRTYLNAVLATNAISLGACIIVITIFFILKRKSPRLMSRTSLKLSIAMACTDLTFHVRLLSTVLQYHRPLLIHSTPQSANLAGYGPLPKGFICAFVGGWLFATPNMLSIFYASAIAINAQLALCSERTVKDQIQTLFLVMPPIFVLLIGRHNSSSLLNGSSVSNTPNSQLRPR